MSDELGSHDLPNPVYIISRNLSLVGRELVIHSRIFMTLRIWRVIDSGQGRRVGS